MDTNNEILDAIEILADKKIGDNITKVLTGICTSVNINKNTCVMNSNGVSGTVYFYGSPPEVNGLYRIFVPSNNMSRSFIVVPPKFTVNPNLLDNWYFGNPINQRGLTSYTGTIYGIDRWVGNRDQTITIADNYLNIVKGNDIASGFSQFLPREAIPTGATVTLSFLFAPGTQKCQFGLRENNNWGYFAQAVVQTDETNYQLVSVTIPDVTLSTGNFSVWLSFEIDNPGSVMRPIAAKLELGPTQTLAHLENGNWVLNEIPDYGEQLARCQRYFQLYSSADNRPSKAVDCRPTMRTDPSQGTIIIDGTTYYYNTADL